MRLLALGLALTLLPACTSYESLSPDEAVAAARDAIEAGDARKATRLYAVAARGGHLGAIGSLAAGYQQGYYPRGSVLPGRPGARHLATRQSDLQARRWIRRHVELVRRPSEDPERQLYRAIDLLNGQQTPGSAWRLATVTTDSPRPTPAQRDSAIALLEGLLEAGHSRAAYALMQTTEDPDRDLAYLRTAAAHGDVGACLWAVSQSHGETWAESATELADYLSDRAECEAMPSYDATQRDHPLDALRAQAERGNAEARGLLDGLAELGVLSGV